jgi:hypothetical protein
MEIMKKFSYKGIIYETHFLPDGTIEMYEAEKPGSTGFVFSDNKHFIYFINMTTDIMEATIKGE